MSFGKTLWPGLKQHFNQQYGNQPPMIKDEPRFQVTMVFKENMTKEECDKMLDLLKAKASMFDAEKCSDEATIYFEPRLAWLATSAVSWPTQVTAAGSASAVSGAASNSWFNRRKRP